MLAAAWRGAPDAWSAGVVGDGTPESCTETAFSNALQDGGLVEFDCGPDPHSITLTITYGIGDDTEIDGGSLVTLNGGNAVSHFQVFVDTTLVLRNILVRRGAGLFGAIENFGTLQVFDSDISLNSASASGGAIANFGTVLLQGVVLDQNEAAELGGAIYSSGGDVTLSGTEVSGNAAEAGGGIYAEAGTMLRIEAESSIVDNTAVSADATRGGGIWNEGELTVEDSAIDRNVCQGSGGLGGGLGNAASGVATLTDTTVNDNDSAEGGGIRSVGTLNLLRVSVSRNDARVGAGLNVRGGAATLESVELRDNTSLFQGGGVYHDDGVLTVANSTISGNENSGLHSVGDGTAAVAESTISGNTTNGSGGGVFVNIDEPLQLRNVTVSGNTSEAAGGGLNIFGPATLLNVTIAGNSAPAGGGVHFEPDAVVTARNTILADSPTGFNCLGSIGFADASFSLSDDGSCGFGPLRDEVDVKLGPLADNGGPTLTHKPAADSAAVDGGSNADCPDIDQRGAERPAGDACDVGAVEVGALATTTTVTTSTIPITTTTLATTTTTVTATTTTLQGTTTTAPSTSTTLQGTTTTAPNTTTTLQNTTTTTGSPSTTSTSTTLPPGQCADPVVDIGTNAPARLARAVLASDALYVLRSAVGSETCADCVCDVDGSGSITATDALVTLKLAVGQSVSLDCPPC